jgi:dTDP-4-dehydrorhamnose 3,5-epimerase-like enzyme
VFLEWYRFDRLAEVVGHPLRLAQANQSVSARGVVRGIHFADVPPGQAKYVTCVRGAALDVVVDLRVARPPSVSGRPYGSMTWTGARSTSPRDSGTDSARSPTT